MCKAVVHHATVPDGSEAHAKRSLELSRYVRARVYVCVCVCTRVCVGGGGGACTYACLAYPVSLLCTLPLLDMPSTRRAHRLDRR